VKKLFVVLVLGALGCSNGDTYPPLISDCDGSCSNPIVSESGEGGSDAGVDASDATDGAIDDGATDDSSIVDTGVTE